MKDSLLLTTSVYPFPSLPQNEAATDVMGQRFTRGNDLFTMVSHTHAGALHLLAQNLHVPSVVLEYPRWEHFVREVARGYSVIGISAYPFHLDTVLEMCRHVRKSSPGARILVGSYAAQTLEALGGLERYGDLIDDLVGGEGVAYLRRLFGEDPARPVSQRFFPKNGAGMRYLGRRPRGHTVLLFTGLGCPGGCDFCSSSAQYRRRRIELLSPGEVVEHVRHYLGHSRGAIQQFYLIDEDHFRFPEYLLELRRFLADSPSILEQADFVVFGSVDHIARFAAEHGWEAIAEAGIGAIFIGVESKGAGEHGYHKRRSADAGLVFERLHRIGVRTIGAWIAGFPFQNRQTLTDDLESFIRCKPTYQQLSIYSAFPGTPLHDSRTESGATPPCRFQDYHFWNPTSTHPEFTNGELLELTEHGYRLGYETWGPCLLRNLEVHLEGIRFCRGSASPVLRDHALHLHRRNGARIHTQLDAMAWFAPNPAVRERIGAVDRSVRELLGPTPLGMRLLAHLSLALAFLFKLRNSIPGLRWTPKVEGFRRYRYDPGTAPTDRSGREIERDPSGTDGADLPGDTPLTTVPGDYFPAGRAKWYSLPDGKDRGKRLAFTDQSFGRGDEPQSLVFVPGNPECSYLFRKVLRCLLAKNLPSVRVITLDHIGFGLSDQATYPMNPADHAANLTRLIGHLSPGRITLVVHDWGGPIGLGALLATPALLRKLLVLNSGILPLPGRGSNYRNHPFPLLSWARLSALVPDRCWGAFASGVITSRAHSRGSLILDLLRSLVATRSAVASVDPYRLQFASRSNVRSSRHLAELSGSWCEVRDGQDRALNDLYARLRTDVPLFWGPSGANIPARLVSGGWDPLGCAAGARLWLEVLPQLANHMVTCEDAGHFLPEHRPHEIADVLRELLVLGSAGS